jgi:hypothetical protein
VSLRFPAPRAAMSPRLSSPGWSMRYGSVAAGGGGTSMTTNSMQRSVSASGGDGISSLATGEQRATARTPRGHHMMRGPGANTAAKVARDVDDDARSDATGAVRGVDYAPARASGTGAADGSDSVPDAAHVLDQQQLRLGDGEEEEEEEVADNSVVGDLTRELRADTAAGGGGGYGGVGRCLSVESSFGSGYGSSAGGDGRTPHRRPPQVPMLPLPPSPVWRTMVTRSPAAAAVAAPNAGTGYYQDGQPAVGRNLAAGGGGGGRGGFGYNAYNVEEGESQADSPRSSVGSPALPPARAAAAAMRTQQQQYQQAGVCTATVTRTPRSKALTPGRTRAGAAPRSHALTPPITPLSAFSLAGEDAGDAAADGTTTAATPTSTAAAAAYRLPGRLSEGAVGPPTPSRATVTAAALASAAGVGRAPASDPTSSSTTTPLTRRKDAQPTRATRADQTAAGQLRSTAAAPVSASSGAGSADGGGVGSRQVVATGVTGYKLRPRGSGGSTTAAARAAAEAAPVVALKDVFAMSVGRDADGASDQGTPSSDRIPAGGNTMQQQQQSNTAMDRVPVYVSATAPTPAARSSLGMPPPAITPRRWSAATKGGGGGGGMHTPGSAARARAAGTGTANGYGGGGSTSAKRASAGGRSARDAHSLRGAGRR